MRKITRGQGEECTFMYFKDETVIYRTSKVKHEAHRQQIYIMGDFDGVHKRKNQFETPRMQFKKNLLT